MKIKKIIRKRFEGGEGANVAGGVNAVVSATVNEAGRSHTSVSSRQRIVQRNGKTVVYEDEQRGEVADERA